MPSSDLIEAQRLLERADRETDPARKLAAVEEGIDFLEVFVADPDASNLGRTRAANLRRTNIRRLLTQSIEMRSIEFHVWIDYIKLLLLRLEPDVKAILADDPSLNDRYNQFVALWKDELLDALQRSA